MFGKQEKVIDHPTLGKVKIVEKQDNVQNVLFILALLLSGLTVYYFRPISPGYCPQNTPFPISLNTTVDNIRTACFFSTEYDEAKALFLKSAGLFAELPGYQHLSEPIPASRNKDMTVDAVYIPGSDSESLVVHVSGLHGVEGFAGSAVQSAYLQLLYQSQPLTFLEEQGVVEGPSLLFVHSLNPYGMRHKRTANEHNVDLDQHFLTSEERKAVLRRNPNVAGYLEVDPFLNPTSLPSTEALWYNDLLFFLQAAREFVARGFDTRALTDALAAGNYYKPTGLAYGGGNKPEASQDILESILEKVLAKSPLERAAFIDLQVGEGPRGKDTLSAFFSPSESLERKAEELRTLFPPPPASFSSHNHLLLERKTDATDLTAGALARHCLALLSPRSEPLCLSQTFGVSSLLAFKGKVQENVAFNYLDYEMRFLYSQKLQDVLLPQEKDWKHSVVARGLAVLTEASLAVQGKQSSGSSSTEKMAQLTETYRGH